MQKVLKYKYITIILIFLILGIIYYFSFSFIYHEATKKLISQQIETSKNEANLIAKILEQQILSGKNPILVKDDFQKSIENTSTDVSFVCMFDDSGKEICHPNKAKIGKVLKENNSIITDISNPEIIQNFKESVLNKQKTGGLRKLKNYTEVVYLNPVKNTNWIVASHANIEQFKSIFKDLKLKLSFLFVLVWLVSSLLIYFFLERINHFNLKNISAVNKDITEKYLNGLQNQNTNTSTKKENVDSISNRLLAERKAQLVPVYINNIAFIYTENKMSFIVELNGYKSSINVSLEELFKNLDPKQFYRASRKIIILAKAIEKVEKYGTTQLRVHTKPEAPFSITISKAKLTDFKKWLGKN